jgi:hypothetical protein
MEIMLGRAGEKTKPIKLVLSAVEWSQFAKIPRQAAW